MTAYADEELTEDAEAMEPEAEAPRDPSGLDGGWWLTCEPKDAKKGVLQALKAQATYRKWRAAAEERWERIRAGERGLTVEAVGQDQDYRVRRGFEAGDMGPGPNIAHQLIQRTAAVLTTDPPLPTVNANSDDATEREASELAERVLRVEGSTAERDDAGFLTESIDKAGTYGSMYAYFCVNPQGGGLQPVTIQAHPAAKTTDDALTPMGPPSMDEFGNEIPGQPLEIDPADITDRYVKVADENGVAALTDTEAEAQLAWQSKVERHLLAPANVTLLPFGATAENASGVIVCRLVPLSEIISRFYDGERPDEKTVKKLAEWKPDGLDYADWVLPTVRELLPATPPTRPDSLGSEKLITDDALCPLITLYLKSQSAAPFGAYVAVGGPDEPIYRGEWRKSIGEGTTARLEAFPLPVAQYRCWDDPGGDPNGVPFVEALANESNIDATLTESVLDYVWRASRPHIFFPLGTPVQPEAFAARTVASGGQHLQLGPGGETPYFEQIPAMDRAVYDVWEKNREGLQRSSGLSSTVATGDQDGSVTSGLQQRMVVEETRVGLSAPAQHRDRYMLACWSILLVLIRAHYDTPRLLEYTGESGDVQVKSFAGVELEGAGDIQISKGSGTMLSPTAKTEMAREELQMAREMGDQDAQAQWHEQLLSNQGPVMGLQDDPHRARIARQIQAIKELAKRPELPPPVPEPPPQVDPMSGQPIPQPFADPVSAEAAQIFAPNPTDAIPKVALLRFRKLSDLLATKTYDTADPRIQQAMTQAFEAARQAAGVQTVAEAQQAQAMQAQAANQAKIAEIDAKKSKDPIPGVPGPVEPGPEVAQASNGPPPAGPQGPPA